ncbi:hypothetical protein E2C01_049264 [Portunus trituberculatus]|uniref:Uncharacterized protein n=1 Tax=Portunus trituberculatus TaxID=210409 RepID=A0A5B7G8Y6_PORTR|nr:hypothetical protein [Portunus trituberculatus]
MMLHSKYTQLFLHFAEEERLGNKSGAPAGIDLVAQRISPPHLSTVLQPPCPSTLTPILALYPHQPSIPYPKFFIPTLWSPNHDLLPPHHSHHCHQMLRSSPSFNPQTKTTHLKSTSPGPVFSRISPQIAGQRKTHSFPPPASTRSASLGQQDLYN